MFSRMVCSFLIASVTMGSAALAQTPTFSRADYGSHSGARGIATADFNRDGWPDVAHANTGGDTVTVLLNNPATGALAVSADVPVGHGPFDIATADFNRDGTPDLAVANADNDTVSVLIGNGSGGFTRTDLPAAGNPRGITAADMNGDARPDIVYTAFLQNRVQVLDGNGAGGFSVGWSVTGVANRPQGVAAADLNHDGRMDLAVAYASPGGGLAILYRAASGSFDVRRVAGEDNLNVLAIADLNRDGWLDAAAASTGNNRLAVYFGAASGMTYGSTQLTGVSPRGVAAADLNKDGRLDIVTANKDSSTVSVFTAQASPAGSYAVAEFPAGRGSRGVVAADFNHDGRLDLATGNQDEASVTLFGNATIIAAGGLAMRMLDGSYGFDTFYDEVSIADVDHDGRLDRISGAGAIFFGNGTQGNLPHAIGTPAIADLNGDGHLDFAFINSAVRGIATMLGDGRGGFADGATTTGWSAQLIATAFEVADVDRDGKLDILVSTYQGAGTPTLVGTLLVMNGNGDGTFRAPRSEPMPASFRIVVADLDGDAKVDLLQAPFADRGSIIVSYGDGTGAFPRSQSVSLLGHEGMVVAHVADLNHDGRPDVVISTFDGTRVLLGTADGSLGEPAVYPGFAYRVSLGDLDGDGNLDLIGNSTVEVRFGRSDGTFGEERGFASFGSYPQAADMNNDGLDDIVMGDGAGVMLNTRQATNTAPTVSAGPDMTVSYADTFNDDEEDMIFLFAKDFDADLHLLRHEWRDEHGTLLGTNGILQLPQLQPGTHELTVMAFDDRGGIASDRMTLTIQPIKEIVLYAFRNLVHGNWLTENDPTATLGLRVRNPDTGAPKVTVPLGDPADYIELFFIADPTQEYKLWIRGKAQNDYWGNDSAWVQFERSLNLSGAPAYRIGTTDALPFNLEECSGCGVSAWGWEDDGWGAVDAPGVRIRFEKGGWQRVWIQRREDGLSIDQIVLSSERYLTARPGTAKNDTTILPERRR
jgi:hypothetical protein